jgi:hypothetical protein
VCAVTLVQSDTHARNAVQASTAPIDRPHEGPGSWSCCPDIAVMPPHQQLIQSQVAGQSSSLKPRVSIGTSLSRHVPLHPWGQRLSLALLCVVGVNCERALLQLAYVASLNLQTEGLASVLYICARASCCSLVLLGSLLLEGPVLQESCC